MSKYLLPLPEIPAGQDFARDSFWWTYWERFTTPMKFRRKVRRTAFEWFDREENRARLFGQPFPPKPIFRAMPPKEKVKKGITFFAFNAQTHFSRNAAQSATAEHRQRRR